VELNIETVVAIWVIVLALALGVSAAINLRAGDPRARGAQLISLIVFLVLITVGYEVSGYWAAAIILALAVTAEAVHLGLRRRRRAT
jgi:hypothetical protein